RPWPPCSSAPHPSRRGRLHSRCRGTRCPRSPPSIRFSLTWSRSDRMRFRDAIPVLALAVSIARSAAAQGPDSAQAAQARAMLEQIARDRPPQAEAAARELLQRLQLQRASLDSLRQKSMAEYWGEVAQLTVQREML